MSATGGLGRKLVLSLATGLILASVVFLALFIAAYQNRLVKERAEASSQVNRLLQVSLENAMLKRDLDGLREIVRRLGEQARIQRVMIVNPDGEVRFASSPDMLGRVFDGEKELLCPDCTLPIRESHSVFISTAGNAEVLRSVNPVFNRDPCQQCHGPMEDHPVNGILVVDYAAAGIKHEALAGALALGTSGIAVVGAAILGIWFMLRRWVLEPVGALTEASQALAAGDYSVRAPATGGDELADLGASFNTMAERIAKSLDDLEGREAFLQALMDAIPDGVRVIGPDFTVVKANRAFCEQVGMPISEVVGKPCYHSSHKRDEPCAATFVTCPLVEFETSIGSFTCRHRHVRPDGAEFHVEVSVAPLYDAEGGRPAVVEAIRDLSQEMAVSQEQKLSEIGLLATGIAHEIRNPLASIRLGFRAMQRKVGLEGNAEAKYYMDIVNTEIDKCIGVTNRLLKLSMPPARPTLLALDEIVSDILSLITFEAIEHKVETSVSIDAGLRVVASDSDMRMLLLNIAQNGFHAMPNGGTLTITGRHVDGEIAIAIADTGVGIRSEDLGRIFDPFWSRRADSVRGTGLGLSICRAIVKHAGGRIEVESELGKGTTFTIVLPDADRRNGTS
ncbi:MAG: ATP-binding protein [Hyphomicrobiales bacterium]